MNRFPRSFRHIILSALLLLAGAALNSVKADEDYRITNDVVLSNVRVLPERLGDRAKITFTLENRSAERILFGGITVIAAGSSRIVASLGNGATTILDSIPVAPDEVLSVDGEVLWIEVDGLPAAPGATIEAKVSFGATVIPISLSTNRESKPFS